MALYDSPHFLDQAAFERMCPALVSQRLFADCTPSVDDHGVFRRPGVSDAESRNLCVSSVTIFFFK